MNNGDTLKKIFEDVTTIKTEIKTFIKIQDDQEKRIRALERIRWLITGGLVLLYGLVIFLWK